MASISPDAVLEYLFRFVRDPAIGTFFPNVRCWQEAAIVVGSFIGPDPSIAGQNVPSDPNLNFCLYCGQGR